MSNRSEIDIKINSIFIFNELEDDQLAKIEGKVQSKKLSKGEILFSNGDQSTDVYFVCSGTVRATTYSLSGREVSYQDLHPGEMFGELSAIDKLPRTTSIVAVTNTTVLQLSSQDFLWAIAEFPTVNEKVVSRFTTLVRFLIGRVYEYSALDVRDRIRAEIIRKGLETLGSGNSAIIEKMPTHEEIANVVATHREAVTKEFSYLVKNGYILKEGRKVIIPDFEKFNNLVKEVT